MKTTLKEILERIETSGHYNSIYLMIVLDNKLRSYPLSKIEYLDSSFKVTTLSSASYLSINSLFNYRRKFLLNQIIFKHIFKNETCTIIDNKGNRVDIFFEKRTSTKIPLNLDDDHE